MIGKRVKDRDFPRLSRMLRWFENSRGRLDKLISPARKAPRVDEDKRLWITARNDASESLGDDAKAPAYAAVKVTGMDLAEDGRPFLTFDRPDADSISGPALVWHQPIPRGQFGRVTWEPWWAKYNDASTPDFDESWGTEEDEWHLKQGNTGFKILGGAGGGRVYVKPTVSSQLICCAANGSNSVALTATGEDIPLASGQQNGITIDAANDRLEIQTDGHYVFLFNFYVQPTTPAASTDDNWQFDFQVNGSGHTAWSHVKQLVNYSSSSNSYEVTLLAFAECEEGDLITVHAQNLDDASRTIDIFAVSLFAVRLTLG